MRSIFQRHFGETISFLGVSFPITTITDVFISCYLKCRETIFLFCFCITSVSCSYLTPKNKIFLWVRRMNAWTPGNLQPEAAKNLSCTCCRVGRCGWPQVHAFRSQWAWRVTAGDEWVQSLVASVGDPSNVTWEPQTSLRVQNSCTESPAWRSADEASVGRLEGCGWRLKPGSFFFRSVT